MSARANAAPVVPAGTTPDPLAAGLSNQPGGPGAGMAEQNQTNSTTTVLVGCKLPAGVLMELGKRGTTSYWSLKLNGLNDVGRDDALGGFAITKGVPAEAFERWHNKMMDRSMFRNGLIFSVADMDSARDFARTLEKQRSGMERIDPKNMPKGLSRVPKSRA